jgi:hypothetical protein
MANIHKNSSKLKIAILEKIRKKLPIWSYYGGEIPITNLKYELKREKRNIHEQHHEHV